MRRMMGLMFLIAAPLAAAAADYQPQRPGGVEVYYSTRDTSLLMGGVENEFSQSRLAIDYSEAANDWLYIGLSLAFASDSATTDLLVDQTDPVGYVFGVFAGARMFERGAFAVKLETRFEREASEGTDGTDTTTVRFGYANSRIGASYHFSEVELEVGGFVENVFGELERTGTLAGTEQVSEVDQGGMYAGLRIAIDGGYSLGLRAESGAHDLIAVNFSTTF